MYEVTEQLLTEQDTAVIRRRVEVTAIEAWIGPAFDQIIRAITGAGLRPDGMPFARFEKVTGTAAGFDVEAGFPVDHPLSTPVGEVEPSRLPGGLAAVVIHLGPYDAMTPAYDAVAKWIADRGGIPDGPPWECYQSEPTGDPSTWRTEIVQPYRVD